MAGSSPSADRAGEVWLLLQDFVHAHDRRGELAARLGFGAGAGRGKALMSLRHGPLTLGELAAANGVDAPYATIIVDKLESHGLVERSPHPDDRRRKLVALTDAGREAVAMIEGVRREPPGPLTGLSPEDFDALAAVVGRLAGGTGT